jgi:ketosteroid isomerase-like protein
MNLIDGSSALNLIEGSRVVAKRGQRTVRPHAARWPPALMAWALMFSPWGAGHASDADDHRILADLDVRYQKAVKENDAKTMAAILADDFVLVEGDGKRSSKADLLGSATSGKTHYEHQEDSDRTIVVSGDTAVVTAKLWAKGIEDGVKVDYLLWFSDVYVRTPTGWRYFFAQASLPVRSKSER